jgi:ABC-type dipeptide/oligopeptide/nickel transport system permease component
VMLLSALFVIGGNLLADILLGICDPRIRSGAQSQ